MEIPVDFLQEEERCGYTVSADMKKVWAVELDLLQQFTDLCDRHGLRWFAGGGTMLGAVRHQGFIPWDDDIDLFMLREDYEKFLVIAQQELKHPYFCQTAYNDKNYSRGHAQLRHSGTTGILLSEKGHYSFNQGIFLDVFPLDEVPDDPALKAKQQKQVGLWVKLLAATVRYPGSVKKNAVKTLIHYALCWVPYRWVYRRMEQACRQYNGTGCSRVALISFGHQLENWVLPKHCFDESQTVPFEFTEMVIPAGYDEILTTAYGDYRVMRQDPTYHAGVLFDTERSYADYLK